MIARPFLPLYNSLTMRAIDRLPEIAALLAPLSITLEPEQPHIGGEREIRSRERLVLIARKGDTRVLVKVALSPEATRDIKFEKEARDAFASLSFAENGLLLADEVFSGVLGGYYILITEFIEEDSPFITRSLSEQFFIALNALEAQEAFHATTFEHDRRVRKVFPVFSVETYLSEFRRFMENAKSFVDITALFERTHALLAQSRTLLERYGGHLTHDDFVPHNMRLKGRSLYVLDLSAFRFGNKYDAWGRFVNYMMLHNPPLARLTLTYLKENRPEEYPLLRVMRAYKLGQLINYYITLLPKTEGNFRTLTELRIRFWGDMLKDVLEDRETPIEAVDAFREARNALRSEEEKLRQKGFSLP